MSRGLGTSFSPPNSSKINELVVRDILPSLASQFLGMLVYCIHSSTTAATLSPILGSPVPHIASQHPLQLLCWS